MELRNDSFEWVNSVEMCGPFFDTLIMSRQTLAICFGVVVRGRGASSW